MQLGTMHAEIGRIVEAFGHGQFAGHFPAIAVAVEVGVRGKRRLTKLLLDPDTSQDLHGIRHHLDAGTDAGKTRRLLVDLNVDPYSPQRCRYCQTAHTGAHNGDRKFLIAHFRS